MIFSNPATAGQWIGLDVGQNTHGYRGLVWIGSVSYSGLGWIGFSKMDPSPTLLRPFNQF